MSTHERVPSLFFGCTDATMSSSDRTFWSRSLREPHTVRLQYRHTNVDREQRRQVPWIITGGACGIDTLAERLAHQHGYRVQVFLPTYQRYSSHTSSTIVRMTPNMQAEGTQKVWEANTILQRTLSLTTLQWGCLQRNYWIIHTAKLVLAFGYSDHIPNTLKGGTGWSVQLARNAKKPLVVYKDEQWYMYDYAQERFRPSNRPRLHPISTAIVGTREMTPDMIHELHLLFQ